MGIFGKKGLAFEKIELSKSKINSDETTTITVNVKNFKEKFDDIAVITKTDDASNQYLHISNTSLRLPSLVFPNSNTGDHEIMLNPYNIPVHKMSFKITVEVYTNNAKKLMLKKEFDLTVNKKQN
ncbi:MAG: hypothetical protein E6K87_07620 [Thaumarchaeota archaeon]|nr:MAG: hypothetical protein AUH84_07650 [Thaumarchaeota archaeon 13_1_40CM_4_38_7]OLC91480.1 MAG: hypothetical protein AUI92_07745 [Thaumarchaeota archaeon 13_1_40CM_3_38_6]OLD28347.1 MAG: hypothetical protein AUI62_04370 [Thaumarchaeota archaeon 13_1_40CM_2_39_7]TLY02615.1 MAG: hypothetical protein E6K87_07620 [Nitrososphaerota archaeon]